VQKHSAYPLRPFRMFAKIEPSSWQRVKHEQAASNSLYALNSWSACHSRRSAHAIVLFKLHNREEYLRYGVRRLPSIVLFAKGLNGSASGRILVACQKGRRSLWHVLSSG